MVKYYTRNFTINRWMSPGREAGSEMGFGKDKFLLGPALPNSWLLLAGSGIHPAAPGHGEGHQGPKPASCPFLGLENATENLNPTGNFRLGFPSKGASAGIRSRGGIPLPGTGLHWSSEPNTDYWVLIA